MPWTVRIQDEFGKPKTPDGDFVVEFRLLESLPAGSHLLSGIDQYADTTFNGQQLKTFLTEWMRLQPQPEDRPSWDKVLSCARFCVENPHHYLKFIGD